MDVNRAEPEFTFVAFFPFQIAERACWNCASRGLQSRHDRGVPRTQTIQSEAPESRRNLIGDVRKESCMGSDTWRTVGRGAADLAHYRRSASGGWPGEGGSENFPKPSASGRLNRVSRSTDAGLIKNSGSTSSPVNAYLPA